MLAVMAICSWAQPEPFPIDKSFVPELSFLQKRWFGEYNGVDPLSHSRISIRRTLCLCQDSTFTNVSYGIIGTNGGTSDEMLLKSERGTYNYDYENGEIKYVLSCDTALDMNVFLKNNKIVYKTNAYTGAGKENAYTEPTNFTYLTDGKRQWVIQDSKLGSDQQQGKSAVYVMTGSDLSTTAVPMITSEGKDNENDMYDTYGNRLSLVPDHTLFIKAGRIYLKK